MARSIPDTTMSQLSGFLKREMGLKYPPERWGELERGLASAAREFGFADTGQCIRWLMSAPLSRRQIETLAGHLTVGETYFYRDPGILEVLEKELLPPLLRQRRGKDQRLRIWSAGCSTGEEPYTIAIMLHRLLPDIADWNITILATDINGASLQRGMAGVYGRWSFRGTPSWFKSVYFSAESDERFRISEEVRRMVCFEYLNLAEDSYPSLPTNTNAMDLIFCRNVLIYFDPETVQKVVGKMSRCLLEGGWLLVGPAESVPRGYPGYQSVTFNGATCYRKSAHPEAPVQAELVAPAALPAEQIGLFQELTATAPAAKAAEEPAAPSISEYDHGYAGAAALYRQGLYQQAAAALRELQRERDLPVDAVQLLIRSEANQGRLSEALIVCEAALSAHKLDPSLHYLRAEILQEKGSSAEAQLALQRALYLDPKLVLAHFALGNLALWERKGDRARKHFENALALLDPLAPEEVLPGSEGMTAGRLREIMLSMLDGARRAGGGRS